MRVDEEPEARGENRPWSMMGVDDNREDGGGRKTGSGGNRADHFLSGPANFILHSLYQLVSSTIPSHISCLSARCNINYGQTSGESFFTIFTYTLVSNQPR